MCPTLGAAKWGSRRPGRIAVEISAHTHTLRGAPRCEDGACGWRVPPVVGAPKSFLARLKAGFGLFKSRHILLMTLACALLQGSHAFYYGFASIIWRDQGIADTVIGPLRSVGVLFEVALLALSARLFAGWSAAALFLLGGVGGLASWARPRR